MFTGLVEEVGRIRDVRSGSGIVSLRIDARTVLEETKIGDSICVSGACLSVTRQDDQSLEVDVVPETVSRTNLLSLKSGDPVNLERSLKFGDRVGGHLVTGHVDGLARVVEAARSGGGLLRLRYPRELGSMIAEKGSVAVEGVSLTVAGVEEDVFSVAVIPLTLEETTLGRAAPGSELNLEVDVLARYVARQLRRNPRGGGRITEEWMKNEGYV
jgi:riboflavin synthase